MNTLLCQFYVQCGAVVTINFHDDVIKWKHFPRNWPFVQGIHRSPVNFPHKGQWCGALMFSLICVWINGWVNNGEVGDLRRYLAHYDVTVIFARLLTVDTLWLADKKDNSYSQVTGVSWRLKSLPTPLFVKTVYYDKHNQNIFVKMAFLWGDPPVTTDSTKGMFFGSWSSKFALL